MVSRRSGWKRHCKGLFGDKNPEGRLPVTFYRSTDELPEFTDYSMKGRTYRYMTNEALYPFGYGLSYTNFVYTDAKVSSPEVGDEGISVSVTLTNAGGREGTETVQAYVKADREGTPNAQLKGIAKVSLKPGESREVTIKLPLAAFALYDEDAVNKAQAGSYTVFIGGSSPIAEASALPERRRQNFR